MARSEEFASGAEEVRQPQFKSVQQMHNDHARATSVLTVPGHLPNQNGMGTADRQRRLMGFRESASGMADSTYDQRLWMDRPTDAERNQNGA